MKLINYIFPAKCVSCGIYNTYLCERCKEQLKPSLPKCVMCHKLSNNYMTHPQCKDRYEEIPINATYLWEYNELASKIISEIKYNGVTQMIAPLRRVIEERIQDIDLSHLYTSPHTYMVPIPQHKQRTRERGFEFTKELAEIFHRYLNCDKFTQPLLSKTRNNKRQASLSQERRKANAKNAYDLDLDTLDLLEKGSHIIMIDDVITTGATLFSAISELRRRRPDLIVSGLSLFRAYRVDHSTTSAS